jgi:hypothetical protein
LLDDADEVRKPASATFKRVVQFSAQRADIRFLAGFLFFATLRPVSLHMI